jgi:peptide/nickel transport system ATP-binding protein
VIKGSIPDPYVRVPGCSFHPRCPDYMDGVCNNIIPAETLLAGPTEHGVRCHLYNEENAGVEDPAAPNATPVTTTEAGR